MLLGKISYFWIVFCISIVIQFSSLQQSSDGIIEITELFDNNNDTFLNHLLYTVFLLVSVCPSVLCWMYK